METPRLGQPPAHVILAADGVHARAAGDGHRIELKPFNMQAVETYVKFKCEMGPKHLV